MFRRSIVLGATVLSLGGCSTLQALGVSQATVDQIQQAAVSICGFLPTVETIAGIVSGGMSAVPGTVANAICAAVAANQAPAGMSVGRLGAPARTGAAAPANAVVGSTKVQGIFVR